MSNPDNSHLISQGKRDVLVLVGPTASGKTPVSLLLARQLNAEIISADSRQVYRYMDIGTAKPRSEELNLVPHHFVDELLPDREFNAGEFGKRGRAVIEDIFSRKKVPLVVGGSGLYVQSLVDGFFEGPPADKTLRKTLVERLNAEGAEALLIELKRVDPVAASGMLPSNKRRIVRALEVYQLTGMPLSKLQEAQVGVSFTSCLVGLQWERKTLYERINERVDRMVEQGLLDEVRRLQGLGYSPKLNSLQTVGYKEALENIEGKITHQRMVELIKQNTRRFAKRQLTWFRGDNRIRWFEVKGEDDFPDVADGICRFFLKDS
jgi:tRNA dimethylallyltransferase